MVARIVRTLMLLVISAPLWAADLGSLSSADAVSGLRDALAQGSNRAVAALGRTDGFLGNDRIRIGLPEPFGRMESTLRMVGMSRQVDDLKTAMNRAAESAVSQSAPIFINAIRQMSISDAKGILTGGDDAATQYFRRTTGSALTERFRPQVAAAVSRVGLADQYNRLARKAARFGLVKQDAATLDAWVTQRALDGLFLTLAEEERAIRRDPIGAATGAARRVFDLLRR